VKKIDVAKEAPRSSQHVRVLSIGNDKQVHVLTLDLPKIKPQVASWGKSTSVLD